jgi:alkaline phosphatase D
LLNIKSYAVGMTDVLPQRRQFLQLASMAAAGAASLSLPRSVWSQTDSLRRFDINPFALGVASGSPTHDSVVLWTRLIDAGFLKLNFDNKPVAVRWEVADDDKFSRIVQSGQHLAIGELAHSVHVEVQNLQPDRWYFYRFMAGDAVSAVVKRALSLKLARLLTNCALLMRLASAGNQGISVRTSTCKPKS